MHTHTLSLAALSCTSTFFQAPSHLSVLWTYFLPLLTKPPDTHTHTYILSVAALSCTTTFFPAPSHLSVLWTYFLPFLPKPPNTQKHTSCSLLYINFLTPPTEEYHHYSGHNWPFSFSASGSVTSMAMIFQSVSPSSIRSMVPRTFTWITAPRSWTCNS